MEACSLKLYEIDDEIEKILIEECNHETGEITESAADRLTALEMDRERIALFIAKIIKGERAEAEAIEREAEKLQRRAKTHKNRAAWLERYLAQHVPKDTCYQDATSRIAWRWTPGRVEFASGQAQADPARHVDPSMLYRHEELRIDKKAAAAQLKAGKDVRGLKLVREQRIKVD